MYEKQKYFYFRKMNALQKLKILNSYPVEEQNEKKKKMSKYGDNKQKKKKIIVSRVIEREALSSISFLMNKILFSYPM